MPGSPRKARCFTPITFEAPQPFSPQASSGYGAALQFSRDLPTLERQQEAIAEAYQRYSAAAAAHGGGGGPNPAILQENQFRQQQYGIDAELQGQQNQANNAIALANTHAVNSAWVNSQEMTQADNLRLQRLQQGLSSVTADPTLSEPDRASLIGMLRSGIEPLQARQSLQLQKHQQAQDAMTAAQEQRIRVAEGAQKTFDAQTTQEHTAVIYNKAVLASLGRQFDEANPDLMKQAATVDALTPGAGMATAAAQKSRQESIEAMAAEHPRGILGHSVETAPGKKEVVWKKDQADQTEKLQADREKRFQTAQAHYDKLFGDAVARVDKLHAERDKAANGNEAKMTPPDAKTRESIFAAAKADLEAKGIKPPVEPAPVEDPEKRFEGNPFMRNRAKPGPQGEPAPAVAAASPAQPQRSAVAVLDDTLATFNKMNVPPQTKTVVNSVIEQSKVMLEKAGGYDKLSEADRKIYDSNRELVKRALARAREQQPPIGRRMPRTINSFDPAAIGGIVDSLRP